MPIVLAMKLMPRKSTAKMPAAQRSVMRAFRHSGGLKAGTPSEIASTPVSAAAPELKARRMRRIPSASPPASAVSHSAGGVYSGIVPVASTEDADADHGKDRDDVEVGRRHEDRPRLADAAQVARA